MQEILPKAYITNILFTGKKFIGHTLKKMQVRSLEECFINCLQYIHSKSKFNCLSFSMKHYPLKSFSSFLCEINHSNHRERPNELVEEAGYQYYEIL